MSDLLEPAKGQVFRPAHKSSIIRNWTFHNLVAHPLMEIAWLVIRPFSKHKAERLSNYIHDRTIPEEYTDEQI
jgi:hypothetical protein